MIVLMKIQIGRQIVMDTNMHFGDVAAVQVVVLFQTVVQGIIYVVYILACMLTLRVIPRYAVIGDQIMESGKHRRQIHRCDNAPTILMIDLVVSVVD